MESFYAVKKTPTSEEQQRVSEETGLDLKKVKNWFQNR